MNQFSAPASTTQPSIIAAKEDAFERLTFLGWRTGLTAIVAGLAASFFLFGYALIYWRNADMDLMVIYNALVLNDGKPQLFFDHTAYLTILSLKLWFRLLHALRRHRSALPHLAQRACCGMPGRLCADGPDRGRTQQQHRASAMDGSRRRIMRSWSGEQGAGHFADRCAAAADVAVRQPEERERCVLAQHTIKLVRSGFCGRRSDCLGIARVAPAITRLLPRLPPCPPL